jgi:hypothetical protein
MSPDDLTALADGAIDEIDVLALTGLREFYRRTDPMPSGLTDRIKFELTLAALHAEVAQLQELTPSGSGARADAQPLAPTESVTFTSSRFSLMVTVGSGSEDAASGTVRIDGWVTGGPADVEVRVGDTSCSATTDAGGRFVIEAVPRGSARFVLRPHATDDGPVITPAIEL